MSAPRTPTKQGDEINSIIIRLNTDWGLDLRLRQKYESPSQSRGKHEDQIYPILQFLFFRSRTTLDKALAKFDSHASSAHSNWTFKPRAEVDTLPSRATGYSPIRTEASIRPPPSDRVPALVQALIRFLKEARDDVLAAQAPRVGATGGTCFYHMTLFSC